MNSNVTLSLSLTYCIHKFDNNYIKNITAKNKMIIYMDIGYLLLAMDIRSII